MPEKPPFDPEALFEISSDSQFEKLALEIFRFQAENVPLYKNYIQLLNIIPEQVNNIEDIPFLPIEFFKTDQILIEGYEAQLKFTSSGTTGNQTSTHHVADKDIYLKSMLKGFEKFYGNPEDYCFLALLPSYLEREGSSLIYMVERLIEESKHEQSGFFLYDHEKLISILKQNEQNGIKTFLIGVTFALIDLCSEIQMKLNHTVVCETGGMKGRKKEMIRQEVHDLIGQGFGIEEVHSEYGMTELLSQAWSKGNGIFDTPPWMKILIRDIYDPFALKRKGKAGPINIIDLANLYSCSFIATSDLGRQNEDGKFEVLGRIDHSDVRGCNLLVV